MDGIISAIISGVSVAILTAIIFAIAGRLKLRTKTDEDIKEIKESLVELDKGQRVLFKMILPLLIAARDGRTNGELAEAIKLYNQYMQEK